MKVCTYNVNSIKARIELVIEWLKHGSNDIEILCLQELKLTDEFFPYSDFEELGFFCEVSGQKTYNGVAICSKLPLKRVIKGFGDKTWDEQKRFIAVQVQGFTVINIYAPHGDERGKDKFLYKQGWYKQLINFMQNNYDPQDSLILAGDFNVTRKNKDVYSPEALNDVIGTMPEERAVFEELLNWGLVDVFRHVHPDKKQFTWWGYLGGAIWKDEGMRIDYILSTESLIRKVKSIVVDLWPRKRRTPTPSDHAPLIATFDIP
jgi:exodeoxyribonuclease-3